jgi:L-seryl-tRNA(Ser) seleniumtransferase
LQPAPDKTAFRALPSVDQLLQSKVLVDLLSRYDRELVVNLVRRILVEQRDAIKNGRPALDHEKVAERVRARIASDWMVRPHAVINATGVILNTNLGRAPLATEALAAVVAAAAYSDLEYDLTTGQRGSRQQNVQELLQTLTGAESAHVAVNNAAGMTLALAALARGKEVVVSRSHLVEIGGGFRVPVIMRQSGARLVEVGTTNRTRLEDYEAAVTDRTAALLHVHSSNFKIVGFTETVALQALAELAHQRRIPLIDDNGSGSLLDTAAFGLAHEPTPVESIRAGADLVAFSGDKLLGGPQAGVLIGRGDLMPKIARHPLARVVRPDKMTLSALSATLLLYLEGRAELRIPVWQMIAQSPQQLSERAHRWRKRALKRGLDVDTRSGESTVGGGSLPGETIPTTLLLLPKPLTSSDLRNCQPPVIGRTQDQRVLLDLRTVLPDQEDELLDCVIAASSGKSR